MPRQFIDTEEFKDDDKSYIDMWVDEGMTEREIEFLQEYINNNFNAGLAYIKKIAKSSETTRASADVNACRVLRRDRVKRSFSLWKEWYINQLREKAEPLILRQLLARATYDIRDFYDEKGNALSIDEIPEDLRRFVIDGIDYKGSSSVVLKYNLPDKHKSIEMLSKYINMVKEDVQVSFNGGITSKIEFVNSKDAVNPTA